LTELGDVAQEEKYDIIGISETWCKPEVLDSEIEIENYKVYRGDREVGTGGGVALFIKDTFQSYECPELDDDSFQDQIWRVINLSKSDKLLVGVIYRSTRLDQENNEKLLNLLQKVAAVQGITHLLIMGDFNLNGIDWNLLSVNCDQGGFSERFLDTVLGNFWFQHVDEPTRFCEPNEPSLLDLIITNDINSIDSVNSLEPLGKSDHIGLSFVFHCYNEQELQSESESYRYFKGNYDMMNSFFADTEWDQIMTGDVEEQWTQFVDIFSKGVDMCVPVKKNKSAGKPPWLKSSLKKAIRKKNAMFRKWKKSGLNSDYRTYIEYRNIATEKVRKARLSYEKGLFSDFKKNPKPFYKYIRGKQKVKVGIEKVIKENGNLTESDPETAEKFSDFFKSVFTRESPIGNLHFEKRSEDSVSDVQITYELVVKKLKFLKTDSTPGEDKVHPKVLKECAESLAVPLVKLFRLSLDSGEVPKDWKNALITPIYKKGSRNCVKNFRPVSLTSVPCKVLESIIKEQIVEHLNAENLINDNQHGFVKGKSCLSNLLEALDYITSTLDQGEALDAIYLDYAKAFDSVPHERLLLKLSSYGIQGKLCTWISSFLTGRVQKVTIRRSQSSPVNVVSGVPQGSVLGPLLFILYVNEIPDIVSSRMFMYADDSKLINESNSYKTIQSDLDILSQWSKTWLLNFNEQKCKIVHFGHNNPNHEYLLNGVCVDKSEAEVDLGVTITSDCKPSVQCGKAARAAMVRLGMLRRTFKHIDVDSFITIYTTYVRPKLEYSVQAWNPYYAKDIEVLERVQKYATTLVPELRHMNYSQRLDRLKMYSLEDRRLRGDLIYTYKLFQDASAVKPDKYFQRVNNCTRGHSLKLFKPTLQKNLLLRKNFYSIRVINKWNELPETVVTAGSVDTFKSRLDYHWQNTFPRYGTQEALPRT